MDEQFFAGLSGNFTLSGRRQLIPFLLLIKESIREKRERLTEGKFLAKITGVTKVLALCKKVDKIILYHHLQGERPSVKRKKGYLSENEEW